MTDIVAVLNPKLFNSIIVMKLTTNHPRRENRGILKTQNQTNLVITLINLSELSMKIYLPSKILIVRVIFGLVN